MELSIVVVAASIALILFTLNFGPNARTRREEERQQRQRVKLRDEFHVRIKTLAQNYSQQSEIRLVVAYFENESQIEKENVDFSLACLKKKGVHGPDFRELFLFLHQSLLEKGRDKEANYLYLRTCV